MIIFKNEVPVYFLLGIDDTDSPTSQDTYALALSLGRQMESLSIARLVNLSCHQLWQYPSVSHTSENIASCLLLDAESDRLREIDLLCRQTLLRESAPGSNAGYALAAWNQFDPDVVVWGKTCKLTSLNRLDGIALARRCEIAIAGILGNGNGVIGALAAVGLRFEGNDGWIQWMPGLDSLRGVFTAMELTQRVSIDGIETERHKRPAITDRIIINDRLKPILLDGRIILPVRSAKKGADHDWETYDI